MLELSRLADNRGVLAARCGSSGPITPLWGARAPSHARWSTQEMSAKRGWTRCSPSSCWGWRRNCAGRFTGDMKHWCGSGDVRRGCERFQRLPWKPATPRHMRRSPEPRDSRRRFQKVKNLIESLMLQQLDKTRERKQRKARQSRPASVIKPICRRFWTSLVSPVQNRCRPC